MLNLKTEGNLEKYRNVKDTEKNSHCNCTGYTEKKLLTLQPVHLLFYAIFDVSKIVCKFLYSLLIA